MRRRYDLRRSDNFPLTGETKHVCHGSGELFVYTGFPVQSVALVQIGFLPEVELRSRTEPDSDSGFYVEYKNVPVTPGYIHFSFTAQ